MNIYKLKIKLVKKYFLTLLLYIFYIPMLKSQCCHFVDSIFYKRAYDYVVTDSLFRGKSVNVSNKLTGTCYICFLKEIKGDKDIESIYKEFYELDKKYAPNDSVCSHIDKQFEKFPNSDIILYFSKIINNELFIDVQLNDFGNDALGEKVYYYFIFDSHKNIKYVYKKIMYGL